MPRLVPWVEIPADVPGGPAKEGGATQSVSSFPFRHDMISAPKHDLEGLKSYSRFARILRLKKPRRTNDQRGMKTEVRNGIGGGKLPVQVMRIYDFEPECRPF